jgi:hypothetical protein
MPDGLRRELAEEIIAGVLTPGLAVKKVSKRHGNVKLLGYHARFAGLNLYGVAHHNLVDEREKGGEGAGVQDATASSVGPLALTYDFG